MSAPFSWDPRRAAGVVPPATHRNEAEHRRELRDFVVGVAQAAFRLAFRPPVVVARARAETAGFAPAIDATWERVTGFALAEGDPIFDAGAQEYKDTALTIDATRQERLAEAEAMLLVENAGLLMKTVDLGFGLGAAPTIFAHTFFVPAGAVAWLPCRMPRSTMNAPVSLWIRVDVVADLDVLAGFFALELGARWRQ